MNQKILERALAKHHLQQKRARPVAQAVWVALKGGNELPEIPEYAGDYPHCYPYTVLSDREARQLAFVTNALPDKAADLQGMWASRVGDWGTKG